MDDQLFDTSEEARPKPGERAEETPASDTPLAVRMRPRSLDELVGQEHILGPGSGLRTAIESGHPHSAILYGPPGAGKTTLARIAAAGADGAFEEESAVNAGKAEIRGVIERARERRKGSGRPQLLHAMGVLRAAFQAKPGRADIRPEAWTGGLRSSFTQGGEGVELTGLGALCISASGHGLR
ncbi:MAG TPA: AAA family ATPase [Solirubrobacterales bacterium]|nr:AAA family ATPase [Solirubrobacterales bacterium]